jgi:signal transduction histidine kinase
LAWTSSIRFRLSALFALSVFAAGSLLLAGIYVHQMNRLDKPRMSRGTIELMAPGVGTVGQLSIYVPPSDMEVIEYTANMQALENLKQGSLAALVALFVVAFGSSWWMAGMALRPLHRMGLVAKDITATDLSRRINLSGPEDELKAVSSAFDAMLDRLEAGFEDQRRFVQDASHELRNPLAVARTNLELALSDPDASPEELRRAAEVAQRSNQRMSTLVEELLVQARSGVPELALADVDLGRLAEEAVEEYGAAAEERRVRLLSDVPVVPVLVKGDASALRRVVGNLLSNALKAAPAGTEVTVQVDRDESWALLSVADQGPGLSPDDQLKVFERYWRGPTSGEGSGLGLSIVRHIVSRHGGQADVASTLGQGAVFQVRLPVAASVLASSSSGRGHQV